MHEQWIAFHLHHQANTDQLLCGLVQPYLNTVRHLLSEQTPYFFIRYAEGGLHIRLRLHAVPEHHRQLYRQLRRMALADADTQPTDILLAVYEPETTRYGNATTLPLAEGFFHASSAMVLHWLQEENTAFLKTVNKAIQLHTTLFLQFGYTPAEIRQICQQFIDAWITYLYLPERAPALQYNYYTEQFETRYRSLQEWLQPAVQDWISSLEMPADPTLQAYLQQTGPLAAAYRRSGLSFTQLSTATGSLMHMHHNRLGISHLDEAFIMYLVLKCMEHADIPAHLFRSPA